jgi:hypothetical protein
MTPTAVSKVVADLDRHERMLQRALAWSQPGSLFETHRKVASSKTVDLLTSDAAGMLAGVQVSPAFTAFMKGAEPLAGHTLEGVVGNFEEHGIGRVLKEREELEAKLLRATGRESAVPDLGPQYLASGEAVDMLGGPPRRTRDLNAEELFPGGAAEAALEHELGPFPRQEVTSDTAGLIADLPDLASTFVDFEPPKVVPRRRRIHTGDRQTEPLEFSELVVREETRFNWKAVEAFLDANSLAYEMEHLEIIAVRLMSGTKPDQTHAAMSASLLGEGVANFVFPGREDEYVDRAGVAHAVGNVNVWNRLSAFIDIHLGGELAPHEALRLHAMVDCARKWTAKGHHVPYSPERANRAYRDLLEILAQVARAHEIKLRTKLI